MSSDPTTWGIQTNGWVTPTAAEILERLELDEKVNIDPNVDVDADAAVGQVNGVFAAQLGAAWEAMGALEASRSRDGAEGAMLDEIGKLTGTARDGARPTTVTCNVVLSAGTTLTTSNRASVIGHPELTFYPRVDENVGYTVPTDGTYSLVFECTVAGVISVAPSTLTVIVTPVTGWLSITNPLAGITGSNIAADPATRLQQEEDLSIAGSSTTLAIAAELEYNETAGTGVPGIISATVLENVTDVVDGNGLPPHSIKCAIYSDGTATNAAIAEAIWKAKPAGCNTYGQDTYNYTDELGEIHAVNWQSVYVLTMYQVFEIIKGPGYIGDTALKEALALELNAYHDVGTTVNHLRTRSRPLNYRGVQDVVLYAHKYTSPAAWLQSNLVVSNQAIARFSADRIIIADPS